MASKALLKPSKGEKVPAGRQGSVTLLLLNVRNIKQEPMAFEFHLHIREDSRQAEVLQTMARQQHITPEEVAQQLLEQAIEAKIQPSPTEQMWGAFSSDEDSAITDEAMKHVTALRQTDHLRDFGV